MSRRVVKQRGHGCFRAVERDAVRRKKKKKEEKRRTSRFEEASTRKGTRQLSRRDR